MPSELRRVAVCQALFRWRSTKNPWEQLQKTVIDDRWNEVIKVLDGGKAR